MRNVLFSVLVAMPLCANAGAVAPALRLRGGVKLGPLTGENALAALKTAAAVTAGGAVIEKYTDLGETAITAFAKAQGELFSTNLIICLCTFCSSCLAPTFPAVKTVAVLWLLTLILNLQKDGVLGGDMKAMKKGLQKYLPFTCLAAVMCVLALD